MKRGVTLLLASLTLVAGLTACGGDTSQGNGRDDALMDGTAGQEADSGLTRANGRDSGLNTGANSRSGMTNGQTAGRSIRNGVDDAMRDAGDAMGDLMDDLTGTGSGARRNSQISSGPSWNGNLKKPEFAGNLSSAF